MSDGRIRPYYMIGSIKNLGSNLPELSLAYCGISKDVCEEINVREGIKNYGDAGVNANYGAAGTNYNSFYASNTNPMIITTPNYFGSLDSRIEGKYTFCW